MAQGSHKPVRNGRRFGRVDHFPRGKREFGISQNRVGFPTGLFSLDGIGDRLEQAFSTNPPMDLSVHLICHSSVEKLNDSYHRELSLWRRQYLLEN
jgi:hypothetical protein